MNWYSKIYWLTRLDSISNACVTTFILSCVAIAIPVIWKIAVSVDSYLEDGENSKKLRKNILKTSISISIIFGLLSLFIPTKNEMILIMAGGKVGDFVSKDSSINKMPGQATEYLSKLLEQQIEELKKDK